MSTRFMQVDSSFIAKINHVTTEIQNIVPSQSMVKFAPAFMDAFTILTSTQTGVE